MKKILLILLPLYLVFNPITAEAKEMPEEYGDYIESVCETYDICPELVMSLIFYESSWETDVTNKDCIGLGQINKNAHKQRMKDLGVTDLTNGYQNILVTVDYLAELFDTYEDPAIVLDRYNGYVKPLSWYAEGNISKYSAKVLKYSEALEREDGK